MSEGKSDGNGDDKEQVSEGESDGNSTEGNSRDDRTVSTEMSDENNNYRSSSKYPYGEDSKIMQERRCCHGTSTLEKVIPFERWVRHIADGELKLLPLSSITVFDFLTSVNNHINQLDLPLDAEIQCQKDIGESIALTFFSRCQLASDACSSITQSLDSIRTQHSTQLQGPRIRLPYRQRYAPIIIWLAQLSFILSKRQYQQRNVALDTLQAQLISFLSRIHYQWTHAAVITLQAHFRGLLARKQYQRTHAAAVTLQALFRGLLDRRQHQRMRSAVIALQASFRGLLARRQHQRMCSAVIALQAHFRGLLARRQHQRMRYAVIALQAHFRGLLARRQHQRMRSAVIALQARFRGLLARRQHQRMRYAVIALQAHFRGLLARKQYQRTRAAVVPLQAQLRGFLVRRQYRRSCATPVFRSLLEDQCTHIAPLTLRHQLKRPYIIVSLPTYLRGLCQQRCYAVDTPPAHTQVLAGRRQTQFSSNRLRNNFLSGGKETCINEVTMDMYKEALQFNYVHLPCEMCLEDRASLPALTQFSILLNCNTHQILQLNLPNVCTPHDEEQGIEIVPEKAAEIQCKNQPIRAVCIPTCSMSNKHGNPSSFHAKHYGSPLRFPISASTECTAITVYKYVELAPPSPFDCDSLQVCVPEVPCFIHAARCTNFPKSVKNSTGITVVTAACQPGITFSGDVVMNGTLCSPSAIYIGKLYFEDLVTVPKHQDHIMEYYVVESPLESPEQFHSVLKKPYSLYKLHNSNCEIVQRLAESPCCNTALQVNSCTPCGGNGACAIAKGPNNANCVSVVISDSVKDILLLFDGAGLGMAHDGAASITDSDDDTITEIHCSSGNEVSSHPQQKRSRRFRKKVQSKGKLERFMQFKLRRQPKELQPKRNIRPSAEICSNSETDGSDMDISNTDDQYSSSYDCLVLLKALFKAANKSSGTRQGKRSMSSNCKVQRKVKRSHASRVRAQRRRVELLRETSSSDSDTCCQDEKQIPAVHTAAKVSSNLPIMRRPKTPTLIQVSCSLQLPSGFVTQRVIDERCTTNVLPFTYLPIPHLVKGPYPFARFTNELDVSTPVNSCGTNALHVAVSVGSVEAVQFLLLKDTIAELIIQQDVTGETPLYHAICRGDIFSVLLDQWNRELGVTPYQLKEAFPVKWLRDMKLYVPANCFIALRNYPALTVFQCFPKLGLTVVVYDGDTHRGKKKGHVFNIPSPNPRSVGQDRRDCGATPTQSQDNDLTHSCMHYCTRDGSLEVIKRHFRNRSPQCCLKHDIESMVVSGLTDVTVKKKLSEIGDSKCHLDFVDANQTKSSSQHCDVSRRSSGPEGNLVEADNPCLVPQAATTAREYRVHQPDGEPVDGDSQFVAGYKELIAKGAADLLHAGDYGRMLELLNSGNAPAELPLHVHVALKFGCGIAYYKLSQLKVALKFLKECEGLALSPGAVRRGDVALSNAYMGDIESTQRNYETSAEHYSRAIEHYTRDNVAADYRMVFPSLSVLNAKLASSLRNASKMVEAVQAYKNAIAAADSRRDMLAAHTSLGNLYQSLGENSSALTEYEQSIKLAEELQDRVSLGWAHGNIGNAYLGLYQKDKALHHLETSLELTIKHEPTPQAIGRAYNNLGTAYQALNDLEKAENYFDLALGQAIYGNDIPGQARVYGNIGNILMIKRSFDRAIPNYSEVLRLSRDRSTIATAYHNRGCAYYEWAEMKKKALLERSGQTSAAFHYHGPDFVDSDAVYRPPVVPDSILKYYKLARRDLEHVVKYHEDTLNHIKGSS